MNHTDESATGNIVIPSAGDPADNARQEFWLDTCREVTQMHIDSPRVLDLYRSFGCRFCVPTHEQVRHVLDALDGAVGPWEKLYPRFFFETLELNFPELVRHA